MRTLPCPRSQSQLITDKIIKARSIAQNRSIITLNDNFKVKISFDEKVARPLDSVINKPSLQPWDLSMAQEAHGLNKPNSRENVCLESPVLVV